MRQFFLPLQIFRCSFNIVCILPYERFQMIFEQNKKYEKHLYTHKNLFIRI